MEYSDIEVIMNNMKPVDRFVFGVKYIWRHVSDKFTKKDTAGPFLQSECIKLSSVMRRIDAGELQP